MYVEYNQTKINMLIHICSVMYNEIYSGICMCPYLYARNNGPITVVLGLFDPLDGAQKQEV